MMSPPVRKVLAIAAVLGVWSAPVHAATAKAPTVTALQLPVGFTVMPEAEQRLVSIAPDGTVAAISQTGDRTWRLRAFRWSSGGTRSTFEPLPVLTAPDHGTSRGVRSKPAGVVAVDGTIYVTASVFFSGAYSGTSFEVQRWTAAGVRRWELPSACPPTEGADQFANAVDDRGRLAVTIDTTGTGSFLVMSDEPSKYAPNAFVVEGKRCVDLGRAVVRTLRGHWAAGNRVYLNGKLAPTILNGIVQHAVAVRWHDNTLHELGDGAAYAVASSGFTVGADAIPGRFGAEDTNFYGNQQTHYEYPTPHAVAWDAAGKRIAIESAAKRSVAYDVADDGTVVGMLQDANGKHFAFRWRAGRLQRLDDLPHPPGWRFESAYAIAPDGTIAGIGTLDGVATVFTWRDARTLRQRREG